jgi:hypothetical protein
MGSPYSVTCSNSFFLANHSGISYFSDNIIAQLRFSIFLYMDPDQAFLKSSGPDSEP